MPNRRARTKQTTSPAGHIAAMVLNVCLLWLVHRVPSWQSPLISQRFAETLWAFDLSIGANLVINAILIFYHPPRFRRLVQMVLNVTSAIWLYTMLTVFPFRLPDALMVVVRLGLIVLLIIIVFMLVFDFVRLMVGQQ